MSVYSLTKIRTQLQKLRHDTKTESLDIQSNFLDTLRSLHLHWASLAPNSDALQIHLEIADLLQQLSVLYGRLLEIHRPRRK